MISFLSRSGERSEAAPVRVMAVVTILAASLVTYTLFTGGASKATL